MTTCPAPTAATATSSPTGGGVGWTSLATGTPGTSSVPTRPAGVAGLRLNVRVADGSVLGCAVRWPVGSSIDSGVPVVLVPFYRTERVVDGGDRGRAGSRDDAERRAFADHVVARGMAAVAVPWWFESSSDPAATGLAGRYAPAVAEHRRRLTCTGLGRSVADLSAVLDAVRREWRRHEAGFGCVGHSLGGKLTLFLAALDRRVTVAVTSEPGLGLRHSNWADPWYLGDRTPTDRDLDEVLAAIVPRRIMLLAGGESDGGHNADLVAAARRRAAEWGPAGSSGRIEVHIPSWPAMDAAYAWLRTHLTPR